MEQQDPLNSQNQNEFQNLSQQNISESEMNFQKASSKQVRIISKKNKRIGLFLLIGPILGVIISLLALTIIQAVTALLGLTEPASLGKILSTFAQWLFILIGIVSVIGFIVGIPFGIIFLCKRELVDDIFDPRSGEKENSIVPEEIKSWNWGAAGLTWIWGLSHGVFLSLLVFLPLVNIVMWVILGIKGSEWAWKAEKWESVDRFLENKKAWDKWGIAFFILILIIPVFVLVSASLMGLNSAKQKVQEAKNNSESSVIYQGGIKINENANIEGSIEENVADNVNDNVNDNRDVTVENLSADEKFDVQKGYFEAVDLLDGEGYNLKFVFVDNVFDDTKGSIQYLFKDANNKVVEVNYNYTTGSVSLSNERIPSNEEAANFLRYDYPTVPDDMIDFDYSSAVSLLKTSPNFNNMLQEDKSILENYYVGTSYSKEYGWEWKINFYKKGSQIKTFVFDLKNDRVKYLAK